MSNRFLAILIVSSYKIKNNQDKQNKTNKQMSESNVQLTGKHSTSPSQKRRSQTSGNEVAYDLLKNLRIFQQPTLNENFDDLGSNENNINKIKMIDNVNRPPAANGLQETSIDKTSNGRKFAEKKFKSCDKLSAKFRNFVVKSSTPGTESINFLKK